MRLTSLALVATLLTAAAAHAGPVKQPEGLALGIMVGGPTGLTGKYYLGGSDAVDIGLGVGPGLRLHGDVAVGDPHPSRDRAEVDRVAHADERERELLGREEVTADARAVGDATTRPDILAVGDHDDDALARRTAVAQPLRISDVRGERVAPRVVEPCAPGRPICPRIETGDVVEADVGVHDPQLVVEGPERHQDRIWMEVPAHGRQASTRTLETWSTQR